ncbi:MAG: hypothetical protein ACKOKE_07065 [Actinomycetota bacterium]
MRPGGGSVGRSALALTTLLLVAAWSSAPTGPDTSTAPDPWAGFPAVEGPDPSREVVAFYYAWYGNPESDGRWIHWEGSNSSPPDTLASDFYPSLGAYSSSDPPVVAQHMAWLREAGVGVIALSYWKGETSDAVVDLVFRTAEHYGIEVAFHIEPYADRTADEMASTVHRLLDRYGASPALYRLEAESLHLPGVRPRPLVFVWATNVASQTDPTEQPVEYWASGVDAIHATDDAFVVACPCGGRYAESVLGGHFDGAYNYASLFLDQEDFSWAQTLPAKSLYIPSVMPGSLQNAIGAPSLFVDRAAGDAYRAQWDAALDVLVRPALVSITSFNEWHEGSQIEPAVSGYASADAGREWFDYGGLPEDGYLTLTDELVAAYLARDWSAVVATPLRLTLETTSDWTWVEPIAGAFLQPGLLEASPDLTGSGWFGQRLLISQDLGRAESGGSVSVTYELGGIDLVDGLTLEVGRGGIGTTEVTVEALIDGSYEVVGTYRWSGTTDDQNRSRFTIPAARLA